MIRRNSPAPEASLLLRPRGAASLWRWRRLEEEERVEERGSGKLDDDDVIIRAPAPLAHLFDCSASLLDATREPELIAGRRTEATGGRLEAGRDARVGGEATPAAAVIELRIVDSLCTFSLFLYKPLLLLSPPSRQ